MNSGDKISGKGRNGKSGRNISRSGNKPGEGKANSGKKVRLQEYLDSLIELHKLQAVLLNQMDKEI